MNMLFSVVVYCSTYPGALIHATEIESSRTQTVNSAIKRAIKAGKIHKTDGVGFICNKCFLGVDDGYKSPDPSDPSKSIRSGYVYLMLDRATNLFKIGHARNPEFREATLLGQVPLIELLDAWEGTREDEDSLHFLFDNKRVRGEWFALSDVDRARIFKLMQCRKRWYDETRGVANG